MKPGRNDEIKFIKPSATTRAKYQLVLMVDRDRFKDTTVWQEETYRSLLGNISHIRPKATLSFANMSGDLSEGVECAGAREGGGHQRCATLGRCQCGAVPAAMVRSQINVKQLIREVFDRRTVWDKWDPYFHSRTVQEMYWAEIAKACNASPIEVRCKWKSLKDSYRKEVRKVLATPGESYEPTWPYYKTLHFLYKQVLPPPEQQRIVATKQKTVEVEFQSCGTCDPEVRVKTEPQSMDWEFDTKVEPPLGLEGEQVDPNNGDVTKPQSPQKGVEKQAEGPKGGGSKDECPQPQAFSITEFLDEIFKRPELWDKNHPHHHHKWILDKLWREVGNIYGMKSVEMHLKWKHLKDSFRKELRKVEEIQKLGKGEYKSRLPYFKKMMFLKDQMSAAQTPVTVDDLGPNRSEPIQIVTLSPQIPTCTDKPEDDDYHFFMSLIPLVRNLAPAQKLKLRSRIQDVVLDEIIRPG
ncbi:hypothetical protein AAG570_011745 [Ranatra chinensis]|uniref:MADF domain-containing protein n=1 Tax=Ranatra chinensis TaxID=642074 RepID=A0ABD0YT87_9HEMI